MKHLRKIGFISLVMIIGLGTLKGQAATEAERFEVYKDPSGRAFRIPVIDQFPTAAEMAAAEEDYIQGKEKLLGKRVTTLLGGITRDKRDVDVPEALKLLRRASYYGHKEATRLLVSNFMGGRHGVPRNEMVAEAISRSARDACQLWREAKEVLRRGEDLPILPGTHESGKIISRAKAELRRAAEEREKKRAEEEAVRRAAPEEVHLEERKDPEDPHELDAVAGAGETDPLLEGEGLRHRRP